MKTILRITSLLIFSFLFFPSCETSDTSNTDNGVERPADPWVFRSVLDVKPRMVTFALNDNLWAAYSTQNGTLYKAWKGSVEFDGAVYTTAHGPQPTSVGDAYIIANAETMPWLVIENGNEIKPDFQYKGHRYTDGHAELMYELSWNGKKAMITEQPEYMESSEGMSGFERIFTTSNVPDGSQIALMASTSSVVSKGMVKTDGDFQVINESPRDYKKLSGVDLEGKLILKSNDKTFFNSTFMKRPLIPDPNKKDEEEEEELPLGQRLIAKSDCKSCHNTFRKTIGPAYNDIAKKYANTEQNVALLSAKVKNGGYGVWGSQVMSAHPNESMTDINEMVKYIMSLDAEEEAQMSVATKEAAPENLDYVYGQKDIIENDLIPGLIGTVYKDGNPIEKLADINTDSKPIFVGLIPQIHADAAQMEKLDHDFGIIFEGYLNITADANYTFRLFSDDGSRLFINDKEIIDNDGLHGADPKDGSIALAKGIHKIKVEYFEHGGGKMVSLHWRLVMNFKKYQLPLFFMTKTKNLPTSMLAA